MMNSSKLRQSKDKNEEDDDDVALPGFRFHPTDEELVGFYLRRKVEKKPIKLELIKQIDIYKYDPWVLPRHSGLGGDYNEGYFFCKRGRKYRNSIRPNRVTGSGFWKATGIDKHVYSSNTTITSSSSNSSSSLGAGRDQDVSIIGLKKTLVYYRGSAGKGTKTDWMMHEFRLPPTNSKKPNTETDNLQEAEVWTLCRILKRNVSYSRKYNTPADCRVETIASKRQRNETKSYCSVESSTHESYINFGSQNQYEDQKPNFNIVSTNNPTKQFHHRVDHQQYWSSTTTTHQPPSMANFSNVEDSNNNINNDVFMYGSSNWVNNDAFMYGSSNWDDHRSVMEFAFHDPFPL